MSARWPAREVLAATHVAAQAAVLLCMLASGASRADTPNASADVTSGPRLPGRPVASRVVEPAVVTQLQARIDAIGAAQAWLNFARYAGQNAVPPPVTAAALENVREDLDELQSHVAASMRTVELPQSRHLRDDLWRVIDAVKQDGRLCGAPKMTAYCEVQLAWAEYEATAGGWRHVDPYIRIAEDYCLTAGNAIPRPMPPPPPPLPPPQPQSQPPLQAQVQPPPSTPMPAAAVSASPAALALPAASPTALTAPTSGAAAHKDTSISVLFAHNRGSRRDIRPLEKLEIARIAERLAQLPPDTIVTLVGHADITGHRRYNQRLSARRAKSVALELRVHGVDPARIRLRYVGSAEPAVSCLRMPTEGRRYADRRRYFACLEPNRRVVIRFRD
jgi:outer membrane protein OmpA-like peptidoglycan-associated protein